MNPPFSLQGRMRGRLGSILTFNNVGQISKMASQNEKRPTKDQVASKQQPQWDPNEHPIFSSGMDGGMTQGHFNLKHSTPNIKDGRSRQKRPTKDQLKIKWPPNSSLNGTLMNTSFSLQGWMGG